MRLLVLIFLFILILVLTSTTSAQQHLQYFREYNKVSRNDERAEMDNFAHALLEDKTLIGYMLYYVENDTKERLKVRRKRATWAQRYLTAEFGIPKSRVVLIYCGKLDLETTVLQPLSTSKPAPRCIYN